jgi:ATP-dependent Clp protease ATP-binding subunit ClpA
MKFIILRTGSAEALDAAIFKTCFISKWISMYWSTTKKEYQRIEKDPALNRRFQPIRKRTYD